VNEAPDEPPPLTSPEELEREIARAYRDVASQRPMFAAGLTAQLLRALSQPSDESDPGRPYRLPDDALRALGIGWTRDWLGPVPREADRFGWQTSRTRRLLGLPFWLHSQTSAADYELPDPEETAYSPYMTSPADYFAKDEAVIDSIEALANGVERLVKKTPDLLLVWRGARSASWGIHSSLFRHLCRVNGVKPPEEKPKHKQLYPDEEQMVAAEREILRTARTDWRFDGMSALETFARIQHAGGPTRLLDVTKNPYIAAWFAVEADAGTDHEDARLMAFATRPVAGKGKSPIQDPVIQLDAEWGVRAPAWHALADATARQGADWGTGAQRRLWVPPNYDPRILAQNAAFLLDGVPISTSGINAYFKNAEGKYWSKADLLASASIFVKTANPHLKPSSNKKNLAPTFTFRVTAAAKRPIREFLETRFGFTKSYIYPDVSKLAEHLNSQRLGLSAGVIQTGGRRGGGGAG
jgi:hypothetical protein